ncbi:MAG: hypothetical protein C4326_00370 [Ignavibacteria bacterium]
MNARAFLTRIKHTSPTTLTTLVGILAVLGSMIFALILYPRIADPLNSKIAEDGYDKLAYGLYKVQTLTYYPSKTPTILRGPLYPAFVAAVLFFGEHVYPVSVQIAQAMLHGATTILCFVIGRMLWQRVSKALSAALLCAIHPFLLWYTARIVIETLSVFLFTVFIALLFWYGTRPSLPRVFLAGVLGGTAALCKQTFLPLPLAAALFMLFRSGHRHRIFHAIMLFCASLFVVLPWTMRNLHLTGKPIPVHTLVGFNFRMGDVLAEHYFEAPLSYMKLVQIGKPHILASGDTVTQRALHEAERRGDYELDHRIMQSSIERYLDDPLFFARKLMLNAVMFWTISSSAVATMVTSWLQLPLVVLSVMGMRKAMRMSGRHRFVALPPLVMGFYVLSHLPLYALARFSLVLIPTLLCYAVGAWRKEETNSADY